MLLSWNEIRGRALAFAKEWADETSEDAEAKSFWEGFFNIFGVTRRRAASFETSFRRPALPDAQRVDAGGVRPVEKRLPLFGGHRLQ